MVKTLFNIIQCKTLIDLGFGINRCLETGNIYIESVKAASLADRCGALHVGDIVLGVNGYTISKLNVEKVIILLYVHRTFVKITINNHCRTFSVDLIHNSVA